MMKGDAHPKQNPKALTLSPTARFGTFINVPRALRTLVYICVALFTATCLVTLVVSIDVTKSEETAESKSAPFTLASLIPGFLTRSVPFPDAKAFEGKRQAATPPASVKNKFSLDGGDSFFIRCDAADTTSGVATVGTQTLFDSDELKKQYPMLNSEALASKLKTSSQIADRWRAFSNDAKEQFGWRYESWPLPLHNLTYLDPPTSLVLEQQDFRSDARPKLCRFKPIDSYHSKFAWDGSAGDQSPTPTLEDLNTPLYSEYDFPDRADEFAKVGSLWSVLRDKYKNASLSTLLTKDKALEGEAVCHISAMVTGNCYHLSESLEECASRWGTFKFDVTMTNKCRNSAFWQRLLTKEEARIKSEYTASRKARNAVSKVFSDFVVGPVKKLSVALGLSKAARPTLGYVHQITSLWTSQETIKSVEEVDREREEVDPELRFPRSQRPILVPPKTISAETCLPEREEPPYLAPDNPHRYSAPFGEPRYCSTKKSFQYPITFGTPIRNMQARLLPKLFDFHPVPLDPKERPIGINDEDLYQSLAALSYYCPTHARGGWDCGRHYEVMGAGCVPYFIDIHAMPPYILSQMPVRLFQEIVREPQFKHIGYVTGAYRDYFRNLSTSVDAGKTVRMSPHYTLSSFNFRGRVKVSPKIHWHFDHSQFDVTNYWRVARKLFRFTRKYLTSEALASYVLTTMGAADAKRVLVVSRNDYDNLHMSLVTGLDGLGVETTVVTARETQGLYKCFNLLKGRSASFDLPWPDTSLIATRRTSYGVSRHGVHGSGIPWANRAHSSKKLTFASRLKVVQHRLFGHMSADKFNASVFDLEHALQLPSPTSPNAPPAITSTTSAVAANNDSAAPKVISKRLLAEIANDKKLSLLHRQEELSFKDSKNRKERIEEEHDKLQPYYDAIIISYYSTSKFPVEMVRTLSAAVDGRIAVTDHEDTMGDPRAGSEEIAKQAFFFSRELRRVNC